MLDSWESAVTGTATLRSSLGTCGVLKRIFCRVASGI
jgi:hypothetical protein